MATTRRPIFEYPRLTLLLLICGIIGNVGVTIVAIRVLLNWPCR
jgi:hypothetical protein